MVPGWRFRKIKDPSGSYRVEGVSLAGGGWISIPGEDPEKLLEQCVTFADRCSKSLSTVSGLPDYQQLNRRLSEILKEKLDEDFPLSVVLLNLDCFIYINDGLGHDKGDKILCRVGEMLTVIAERYGSRIYHRGDEYGAILTKTNTSRAEQFVREVIEGMRSMGIQYGHPTEKWIADKFVSITAGVATTTSMNVEAVELLETVYAD